MINKEEIKHIAKLSRIEINTKEEEKFSKDLDEILNYFNLLEKVNVSKIEPSFHPNEKFLKKELSFLRKDESFSFDEKLIEKIIKMTIEKKDRYVKVKTILK
ncbi:MAG TPA: Asp-tRNA(Asn)/Glu-tRNA(Gln) amidotransferase subunit GatC [Candidatus Pacearchaeota archaeon]|nr:Asp-tRNA(Asn)/Glu-tRNA(Gln) amidotransferase subunit GatC [Candidatus Pacearchaeota archaeon]HOL90396.1 Asp-tRNA(Asn)/Glu-tRNA(Gln) amidotransferase subunit GatC [Candidatus Pacearchaeota archaeon]HPO68334.1 Asp-tRNA(Asn)/Glu-tRNA(Gln) amidotransferase subunit GatC [Candidatus Pacearchaeota archaeon]